MTTQQMLAFAIVGVMMVLFIWGRLRYDVVAMLALLASLLAGCGDEPGAHVVIHQPPCTSQPWGGGR